MSGDGCVSQHGERQLWTSADLAVYANQLNEKNLLNSIISMFGVWTSCGGFSLASLFVWGYLACFLICCYHDPLSWF